MKKYFPLNAVLIALVFVLGLIALPNFNVLKADKSDPRSKKINHYEKTLLEINLKTLKGKKITKSDLKEKLVIVNFWATWCRPCLEEIPSLVKLRKKFPSDNLIIVGINSDDENQLKNVKKTIKKYGINFDIVLDKDGALTDKYLVTALPVSIIYHKGKVIEVSDGPKDFSSEEFYSKVSKLTK